MRLGGHTSEQGLRDATRNALLCADEHGLRSIAFPAIGTGIAGFPIERCAVAMLEEIRDHLRAGTSLERIELVLFDEHGLGVFQHALAKMPD